MNINFDPMRNVLNSSTFQLVLKPILFIVTAIALATLAVYVLSSYSSQASRRFLNRHQNDNNSRNNHEPAVLQRLKRPDQRDRQPSLIGGASGSPTSPRDAWEQSPFRSSTDIGKRPPLPLQSPVSSPHRKWQLVIPREQLHTQPTQLINQFVRELSQRGLSMEIEVTFTNETGKDDGGISRTFFREIPIGLRGQTELISAGLGEGYLQFGLDGKYLIPSQEESLELQGTVYQDLGALLAYVYFNDRSFLIGDLFHEAIYGAMLAFSENELDINYDRLPLQAKLRVCHVLAQLVSATKKEPLTAIRMIEFLQKGAEFTVSDLRDPDLVAFFGSRLKEHETNVFYNDDMCTLNLDEIQRNPLKFQEICLDLLKRERIFDANNSSSILLWDILPPSHAVARGMKNAADRRYGEIRRVAGLDSTAGRLNIEGVKSVKTRIQGSLDREEIIIHIAIDGYDKNRNTDPRVVSENELTQLMQTSSFVPGSVISQSEKTKRDFMRTQVAWIEEWIRREETSDTQVEGLLKYWTGTTCIDWSRLPKADSHIKVQGMSDVKFSEPGSSTCIKLLQIRDEPYSVYGTIYSNQTKERFFGMLDFIALPESSEKTTKD